MGELDTVYDPFIAGCDASGIEEKFTAMWTFGAVAAVPETLGFLVGGRSNVLKFGGQYNVTPLPSIDYSKSW